MRPLFWKVLSRPKKSWLFTFSSGVETTLEPTCSLFQFSDEICKGLHKFLVVGQKEIKLIGQSPVFCGPSESVKGIEKPLEFPRKADI